MIKKFTTMLLVMGISLCASSSMQVTALSTEDVQVIEQDLESYCAENSVSYNLAKAVMEYDSSLDIYEVVNSFHYYAETGIDVCIGVSEVLGVSEDVALSIVERADSM